jgi:hypothetical protein
MASFGCQRNKKTNTMKKIPESVKDYFRKQGSKGGKKSAAMLTDKQKKARASKAAKAMWAKQRKAKP